MLFNLIINLVLCALMLSGLYFGMKRGFVSIAARPVKLFASLAIAISACRAFAESVVIPIIKAPITSYVSDFLNKNTPQISESNVTEKLPTMLKLAAGLRGVDVREIAGEAEASGESVIDALSESLTAPLVNIISVIIGFFVVYLIARVAIALILVIFNRCMQNGVFGWINKAFGFVFGFSFAFIVAWVVVVITELLIHSQMFSDNSVVQGFNGSFLYGFMKRYNPIELLLSF